MVLRNRLKWGLILVDVITASISTQAVLQAAFREGANVFEETAAFNDIL